VHNGCNTSGECEQELVHVVGLPCCSPTPPLPPRNLRTDAKRSQFVREAAAEQLASAAAQRSGGVYLIDRPGLEQASVLVSEPGVTLLDPDAYTLDVLATTLNGFGGQLFDQARARG
jgi:hypothetical protein